MRQARRDSRYSTGQTIDLGWNVTRSLRLDAVAHTSELVVAPAKNRTRCRECATSPAASADGFHTATQPADLSRAQMMVCRAIAELPIRVVAPTQHRSCIG